MSDELNLVGYFAKPKIGPHAGKLMEIVKVEYGTGARNGWFTLFLIKDNLLFAGEEIDIVLDRFKNEL